MLQNAAGALVLAAGNGSIGALDSWITFANAAGASATSGVAAGFYGSHGTSGAAALELSAFGGGEGGAFGLGRRAFGGD